MQPDEDDPTTMVYAHPNFCTKFFSNDKPSTEKLVKIWYYGITTLSTIGYGDMYPVSPQE